MKRLHLETRISNLTHADYEYFSLGECSGAEIYRLNDIYVLFEIPLYGGEPRYSGVYNTVKQAVDEIMSWT
jgi:hypothetical protein